MQIDCAASCADNRPRMLRASPEAAANSGRDDRRRGISANSSHLHVRLSRSGHRMRSLWLAAALAVALGTPLTASARSDQADVALVLTIDVSGSVTTIASRCNAKVSPPRST